MIGSTLTLSKNAVVHAWQGTNVPPRMPMKNRMVYRPETDLIVPARPDGMAPTTRSEAMTLRGPKPVVSVSICTTVTTKPTDGRRVAQQLVAR
jgi:hypothetical protein